MNRTAVACLLLSQFFYHEILTAQDEKNIKGLVASYIASDLNLQPGEAVKRWPASSGSRPEALVWQEKLMGGKKAVAPQFRHSKVMGFPHASLSFRKGNKNEMELMVAKNLVKNGHPDRTVFLVYRSLSFSVSGGSRIAGFGSSQLDPQASLKVWNIGADADAAGLGYGSLRFDGTFLGPHAGKLYPLDHVLIRAVVMDSGNRFTEYIQPVHDFFQVRKVLDGTTAPKKVGPFSGDFVVGDLHPGSAGGSDSEHAIELFELQVFDRALPEAEVREVLKRLNWRYTNPEK